MRENRLSGGVGGVAGYSRHPDPIEGVQLEPQTGVTARAPNVMPPQPIKAVTFDVGGTLIEPCPSVGHVYAAVAAEQGYPGLDPGLITARFLAAWHGKGHFDYSEAAWYELVKATFAGLIEPPPNVAFFQALYQRFCDPKAWEIYDDVRPTFRRLKELGVAVGMISNWDERLPPLLRALGLSTGKEVLAVSCQVGVTKPDPAIFQHAAGQLGCLPGSILHVGDSRREDFEGAIQAGFQARLLRRGGAVSDGIIATLSNVIEIVETYFKRG